MNRLIRVTFRDGEWALVTLPVGMNLAQLWRIWRQDGDVIGDQWCAQFNDIARAKVVDGVEIETATGPTKLHEEQHSALGRMTTGVAAGQWKPVE